MNFHVVGSFYEKIFMLGLICTKWKKSPVNIQKPISAVPSKAMTPAMTKVKNTSIPNRIMNRSLIMINP